MVVLGGFKGVLDLIFAIASVAYGLRRLSRFWTGAAIRVMRTSDNSELDIGFIGEDLDVVTLLAFVGLANGEIVIWYDQSGNGRHAVQTKPGSQPRIVNAGVIETHQGKPTLYFDGADDYFIHTLSLSGESIVMAVVNSLGLRPGEVAGTVVTATPSNTRVDTIMASVRPYFTDWGSFASGSLSSGITIGNDYSLLEVISNNPPTGLVQLYTNGVFSAELAGGRFAGDHNARQSIGAEHSWGGNNHYGYIAEVLAFPSVLSTTDRQTLERNQGGYFGITVA
jgi:hypothetical protein